MATHKYNPKDKKRVGIFFPDDLTTRIEEEMKKQRIESFSMLVRKLLWERLDQLKEEDKWI